MKKLSSKAIEKKLREYFLNQQINSFRFRDLDKIFSDNWENWNFTASTSSKAFITFLVNTSILNKIDLQFPSRKEIFYTSDKCSPYQLVQSIKPNAYFSHLSAVYLHKLTDQIPKTIYINFEQPAKPVFDRSLVQSRIDLAFKNSPRETKNIAEYDNYNIKLLNGMFTGNLGITEVNFPPDELLPITDIERTLIDIVVRPVYSGGIYMVLDAYKAAQNKVSINKLTAYLQKLNYVYPYHQAIGFYLEKTGAYSKKQIDLLRKFEMKYDFYLTHQMKEMDYSPEWKLYYPKGF